MLTNRDITDIRNAVSTGTLEQFLLKAEDYYHMSFVCSIIWCDEDIQSLRPEWPSERIEAAGRYVAKGLRDRSTEEGWQILEDLLDMFEEE